MAYWRLGEAPGASTAADSSGNNRSLAINGGVTRGTPGALTSDTNTAMSFDASTGHLRGGGTLSVGADFSLEAWVRSNSSTADGTVLALYGGGQSRTLYLQGRRFLGMADIGASWPSYTVVGPDLDPTVWHHIAFTVQGGSALKLFIDGNLASSVSVPARPGFSSDAVVAWSGATWFPKFGGTLDEVALYPVALATDRVRAHFEAGKGAASTTTTTTSCSTTNTCSYATSVLADAPTGYWRLGEVAGTTTTADSSGQNRTLSVNGGVAAGATGVLTGDTNAAMSFDGSTGYLRGADAIAVGSDFTIEAWIRANSTAGSGTVVSLVNGANTRTLYHDGRRFLGMADIGAAWPSFTVFGPDLDSTVAHHVVFTTQGGSALRLYVDGSLVSSVNVAARAGFSSGPTVGWSAASWFPRFSGALDEVAVYTKALTAERVRAHFEAGRGVTTTVSSPAPAPAPAPAPVPTTCTSSIQALVDAAVAGSTVGVPPCIYRETVRVTKPLTLAGQSGAEIRGSDVWSTWNSSGSTWVSQQSVPALPTVTIDAYACEPNTGSRCLRNEQVFIDGRALTPLAPGSTPGAGQFALVSSGDRRVRLGENPSGRTVEVTVRPRWIVTQADGVTIQGFTMRHAGNSHAAGAVSNDGRSNWTLQDNALSDAHAENVSMFNGANVRVLRNDIGRAGLAGLGGSNVRVGGVVQGNNIHHNGLAEFNKAWGAGGLKVTAVQDFLIDSNEAGHNNGHGLWCDIDCVNVTISRNRVHHSVWVGILFEISNGAKIHSNAAWENGWGFAAWGWGAGIVISSSGNAEVHNNVVAWNHAGISVIAQGRPSPAPTGIIVRDNSIIKKTRFGDFGATYWDNLALAWLTDAATPIYDPGSGNRGSGNSYWYDSGEGSTVRFSWNRQYLTLGEFNATQGGTGGWYMSEAQKTQLLRDWGIPGAPER